MLALGMLGIVWGGLVAPSHAQWRPSLVEGEVGTTLARQGGQPFWLYANTSGFVDPASASGLVRLGAWRSTPHEGRWAWGYGVDLAGRVSENATLHPVEAYLEGRWAFLRLRVGRKREQIGTGDPQLSSGSLGTSQNATPIPKIELSTDGYTGVPFSREYVQFKGHFAHGWLGNDRFVQDTYLHQKSFYVRAGGSLPVNLSGGLVHNAMWGGTSSDDSIGSLPRSLDDFWRTVVALNGGEDAPATEQVFIQGNHLGIIDVALTAEVGPFTLSAHRHFIYEDKDNLKLKSPQDGLLGIALVDRREGRWVERLTYEHLYTKWQNGPIPPGSLQRDGPGGWDDYYNHGLYRSGWTYHGRTVGSPLLLPGEGPEEGVISNRVVGHHLGLAGHASPSVAYRLLATYTRNYGTYRARDAAEEEGEPYRFDPPRVHYAFLLETRVRWPSDPRFTVRAAVGADAGNLRADNVGLRLGLVYRSRP